MTSVRSRLMLVLALILILPAGAAIAAVGFLAPNQVKVSARGAMVQAAGSTSSMLVEQCRSLGESARGLALQAGSPAFAAAAAEVSTRQPTSFVALVDGTTVKASAGQLPPDLTPAQLVQQRCSGERGAVEAPDVAVGLPVVAEIVPAADAAGTSLGSVVVGRVLDAEALRSMMPPVYRQTPTGLALACPNGRGVSTVPDRATDLALRRAAVAGSEPTDVGDWQVATAAPASGLCAVAAAVMPPSTAGLTNRVAALLAIGLLLALGLALYLANSLSRPILALTEAAERVARGDLTTRLPNQGSNELGRLSGAFNHMTDELQAKLGELERSRDLLRENVNRLGDTLQHTHDLDGLLMTVLAASASATSAQRATVWLVEGSSIVARVTSPSGAPRPSVRRVGVGSGLAGEVAADGVPRRLETVPNDTTVVLGGPALCAPLRRGSSVIGVVVVERDPRQEPFGTDDEATLVSLAGPAGIAVDNVLLHREAQRLSITDPLTGAGNMRHMTTTLAREVERATRFARPLSLLLLDLDHFKAVNDTYGHTVGDAVLTELARRLTASVREVDVVTRYGGEEFVIITPETDLNGAQRLADRILGTVSGNPFHVGAREVPVTVSVGIASLPLHGSASGDLVRAADEALYAAKRAGRNRYRIATRGTVAAADDVTADR